MDDASGRDNAREADRRAASAKNAEQGFLGDNNEGEAESPSAAEQSTSELHEG